MEVLWISVCCKHLNCLILMVFPSMSYLLVLGAAFLPALYLSCPCTFLILNADCVFHGERYYNYKGQTYVWRDAYTGEWSNQLIGKEQTTYICQWIVATVLLWNLYLHRYRPCLYVAIPTGGIKVSVLHTVLWQYIFLSISKLTKNNYWTFASGEVNMFKRI